MEIDGVGIYGIHVLSTRKMMVLAFEPSGGEAM